MARSMRLMLAAAAAAILVISCTSPSSQATPQPSASGIVSVPLLKVGTQQD